MLAARLILDPDRAPVVGQIYTWRTVNRLSVRAITARLNADPAAYPTPDGKPGWTVPGVAKILANPKYTGHMVYGRTRTTGTARARPVPPDQWIWTPQPTHPAIIDRPIWDAAQKIGAERGNIRDPETPAARPGRRYILRSRIRHNACQRRMCGMWRTSSTGRAYIYYRCPHDPANPRHAAAHPDHGTVALSETAIMAAIGTFFDQYVFGHDRAALLAEQLPATSAEHAQAQARHHAHLTAELARIDTAERALISELEQPADPADPASHAYRARIRARFTDLYAERTRIETTSQTSRQQHPPTTTRPCSTCSPSPPPCSPTPPTGSKKPCSPHSTSRPSTGTTKTRSPSGPPSPTTPPAPSPPSSATPAPTATPTQPP